MKNHSRIWIAALSLLLLALALASCQAGTDRSAVEAAKPESAPTTAVATATTPGEEVAASPTAANSPAPSGNQPTLEGEATVDSGGVYLWGFTEEGEPFQGNLAASVVIEEFSSFQCPYCAKFFSETYPQVINNYVESGQVLYIYRDFPLQTQPQSPLAAQAANCAGQVSGGDGFWQMHDHLFENQHEWSGQGKAAEIFKAYAADLGLNQAKFGQCLDSTATLAEVEADAEEGASRGVRGTPTFFINGQALVGAQPYAAFAGALDAVLAGQPLPGAEAARPDTVPTPATISPADQALVLGDPDAPVTIVEFSDYQCPFCERHFQQTWPQLKSEFVETGRVRYIFKDFPLTNIHPQAPKAHEAARCAGEQGAYWAMHNRIFNGQTGWAGKSRHVEVLKGYGLELGLDTAAFDACLDSGRWAETVQNDLSEGVTLGVRGTPTFFIEGYPLVGAQPYEVFQQAIQLAEEGRLGEALQPSR